MEEEESIGEEVLFALCSANRMNILVLIQQGQDLRLTDLARRTQSSVQETSKHLGRLVDCKIVEKASDGTYKVTAFGRLILGILPSVNFVSEKRKYFLSHDLSFLPRDLLSRIGDLKESRFQDHVANVLLECQHLLGMAEKYFSWSIDEPLPWFIKKKFEDTTPVRVILPVDSTADALQRARDIVGGRAEFRFANKVLAGIALNEKVAGVVFPDLEGKLDYSCGFIGYSQEFQVWCYDLFSWMWETASPRWPQEIEEQMTEKRRTLP